MKIKSMLFPFAVIMFVACISYYVGSSMRGRNYEQQSTPSILPIVPKQVKAMETTHPEPQDFKDVLKSAQKGDPKAQLQLGKMYSNGEGVTRNSQEAVKWYTKAAEQGDVKAQCRLGFMYENGCYVTQDYQEAFKWYTKAAEQGNTGGQCALGKMYADGKGVTRDDQESIKWYTKAAEQGNKEAQVMLGAIYSLSQDYVEAYKWLILATAQATAQSDMYIFNYRDNLKDRMSPQQIDEAQKLAKEFIAKNEKRKSR
ncbi:MAG: tetratricopeptide repeat protein [Planctomycetota bacterium]